MVQSVHTKQYDKFREILIDARKKQGLTQAKLAKKMGTLQTFVSKYERGERRLDVIEFLNIAKALNIDPHKILKELQTHTQ